MVDAKLKYCIIKHEIPYPSANFPRPPRHPPETRLFELQDVFFLRWKNIEGSSIPVNRQMHTTLDKSVRSTWTKVYLGLGGTLVGIGGRCWAAGALH